jgi:hypothetical protein
LARVGVETALLAKGQQTELKNFDTRVAKCEVAVTFPLISNRNDNQPKGGLLRQELESVLSAARSLPAEELPRLVGDLEEIKCVALGRLITRVDQHPLDELLDIEEAARRIGVSVGYLYHNHRRFPFTRRVGRRLLFSANGIQAYLRSPR